MTRLALQPRWWAWHLALVAILVSFGWLGWWQLQSFERPPTASAPAGVVELDRVAEPGGRLTASDLGRRVRAEGTWDVERQLLVPGRELDGRLGSLVVTALRTTEGVLPVVRGWVPEDAPAPAPPPGAVVVVGVVQPSETEADALVGPGGRDDGEVAYVATVALLERLPYAADELYDGYVVLRGQRPADPAGPERVEATRTAGEGDGPARWRNLAYALQWWVFAGAAVFLWWSVLRRAAQERVRPPEPDAAPGSLAAPRRTT